MLLPGGGGGGGAHEGLNVTLDQRCHLVVQRLDSAIHGINLYSVDSGIISFPNTYPLDSDLSDG